MSAADFTGSYSYHVDEKGRTKLPAGFVAGLGAEFVATRGLDGCVWLLPASEWQALLERLRSDGFGERSLRRLQRIFIGSAVTCTLDPQGRLAIPALLRAYAGIGSEIMVAGLGRWVEVWARERWGEETERIDATELDELLRTMPRSA